LVYFYHFGKLHHETSGNPDLQLLQEVLCSVGQENHLTVEKFKKQQEHKFLDSIRN
jgi:hypothetical protein